MNKSVYFHINDKFYRGGFGVSPEYLNEIIKESINSEIGDISKHLREKVFVYSFDDIVSTIMDCEPTLIEEELLSKIDSNAKDEIMTYKSYIFCREKDAMKLKFLELKLIEAKYIQFTL